MSDDSSSRHKEAGASVTWGPTAAIVGTITAYFVSQFVLAALITLFFKLANWSSFEITAWLDSTFGQFLIMLASAALSLLVLWVFLDKQRASWRALGLKRWPKANDALYILLGFAIYFGLFIIAGTVARLLGVDTAQEQEIGFESATTGGHLALVFVGLVVLPPIVEELLFRGFLFGGLRTKLTFIGATVLTSALFAAPHLLGSSTGLLWIAAIDTFVLSLVLCHVREKTGALWASIGIHAVKNGLAFIFLFVVVQ
jgi:membrane protease YdiL (CAAX protease family)